jgi:hypothetical protein
MLDIKIKIHNYLHIRITVPFPLTCHPSPKAEDLRLLFIGLSTAKLSALYS